MADAKICYDGPLVTCREAFDRAEKRYFTGHPCRHGHVAQRLVSNGMCAECLNIRRALRRQRYAEDPDLRKKNYETVKEWRKTHSRAEESRRWREKHPDIRAAIVKRHRDANAEKIRENNRLSKARMRKINPEREAARMAAWMLRQEAKKEQVAGRKRPKTCDICPTPVGRIVFDHCHASGKFRGWLCDRCNKVLGLMKDDLTMLSAMACYLEKNKDGTSDN